MPIGIASNPELDRYVAKRPIWSIAAQTAESSFLKRLAVISELLPPDQTPAGALALVGDNGGTVHGGPGAVLHHVSGPASQEEMELLRELISRYCAEEQESLLPIVDLLRQGDGQPSLRKSTANALPAEREPASETVAVSWMEEAVKRGLFCDTFYRRTNPDLSPETDLRQHYQAHGWRERRDPSQFFSAELYLDVYPDVAASGMNPLEHYIRHGSDRSRFASKIFD